MIINLSKIDFGGVAKSGGGNAKPEETFDVQPTTTDQTITPTEGSVFSGGTVRAVTSEIDNNIVPGNIKEGVSILGVAGTLEEGITPAGTIAINLNGTYDVTTFASVDVEVSGDTPDYRYAKGAVDKAGLKAIGWTDEDILTYEQNIPPHYPWQNDQFKVSDENKALYLLDDPNPSSYKDNPNITFAPNKKLESYSSHEMKYIKGIPFYDTSSMPRMNNMFYNWAQLITIPQLDTSNVTNMSWMFNNCSRLATIPQLDTSNVTNMNSIFSGCSSLTTIPLLNTSNVTIMSNMFYNCDGLTTIPQLDTSKVTDMDYMFADCNNLITIPQLDTSNVTNMMFMFGNCSKITTIPQLNTSNVTNMGYMFDNCSNLTTVEGIDFSGLTSELTNLFGWYSGLPNITHFIVNGKINVSIKDDYGIYSLIEIDYDSVKSILAAADRTDNTNAKTLAFNRTIADQNGELAALVASCTSKGWTISGLTLQ